MSSFVTNKKALLNALKQPMQAAKTAYIKNTCTFTVKNGSVKVTGSNSFCTVESGLLGAVTVGYFVTSFDASKLAKYIKTLGNGDIEIVKKEEEDKIVVKYGDLQVSFDTYFVLDFIEPDSVKNEVVVDGKIVEVIKDKLLNSMPKDDIRKYLNGMYWNEVEGILNLVTTNGHILSAYTTEFEGLSNKSAILPYETVMAITKLDSKAALNIRFYEALTVIRSGETAIISTNLHGKYPDYQRVLNQKTVHVTEINGNELLKALKQLKILSEKKKVCAVKVEVNYDVNLSYSGTTINISCENKYVNEPSWFGVNVDYFISVVESALTEGTDKITLMFKDEKSVIFVKSYRYAKDFVSAVMPIRM